MPLDVRDGDTYRWFELRTVQLSRLAKTLKTTLVEAPRGYTKGRRLIASHIAELIGASQDRGLEIADMLRARGYLVHRADRNFTGHDPGTWEVRVFDSVAAPPVEVAAGPA